MAVYAKPVITQLGLQMIADATGGEAAVQITQVQLSNHKYPSGTNYSTITTLSGVMMTRNIDSVDVEDEAKVRAHVLVNNTGVATAFEIQNIGLLALNKSGATQLFAVVYALTADTMPTQAEPYSLDLNVYFPVTTETAVNLTVNPSGMATLGEVEQMLDGLVPQTRRINNKALTSDITLTASDVGAQMAIVAGTATQVMTGNLSSSDSGWRNPADIGIVTLSGDQSITGGKTFTAIPKITATLADSLNDTSVVSAAWVKRVAASQVNDSLINFPNMWTPLLEYDFGNGLFNFEENAE